MSELFEPDAADFTPGRMLTDVEKRIETEFSDNPPSKAIVVLLWDDDDGYRTQFYNAGLKCSEALALLEVEKQKFLKMLCGEE